MVVVGVRESKRSRSGSRDWTRVLGALCGHPGVLSDLCVPVVAPKCRPTRVASSSLDSRVFLSRFRKSDTCLSGGVFILWL